MHNLIPWCPAMEWSDGDNWSLQVELSPGMRHFKCAVVRQDGSVAAWEPGANRTVEVYNLTILFLIGVTRHILDQLTVKMELYG